MDVSEWRQVGMIEDGQFWIDNGKKARSLKDVGILNGKQVIISLAMPDHMVIATEHEIILSEHGWEAVIHQIAIKNEVNHALRQIIDRQLGDILSWLRGAGHAV